MKESLAIFLMNIIGLLPLWLARAIGVCIGYLVYLSNNRATKVTRTNIRHCFAALSEAEQEQLVRASMLEFCQTLLEIPLLMKRSAEWVQSKIKKVHNKQLLLNAEALGKGLVVLCPHLGNWEVMSSELSEVDDLAAMYEPLHYPRLDKILRASRAKNGARLMPTNKHGVMGLLKNLKAGKTIMLLPDQVPDRGGGSYADFFGKPTLTMTLAHKLVQRSGAVALMASVLRVSGGFEVFYDELGDDFFQEEAAAALLAMNLGIEKAISRTPQQYQWEYKRFKRPQFSHEKIYK